MAIKLKIRGDRVIWMVILILSVVSILAVYSSTGTLAYKVRGGNTGYYLIKQVILLMVGVFIIIFAHQIPYKYYSRLSQIFLFIAIPLLLLTLATGASINEARRWLTLPGTGFTIQPSDFAKLAVIMYVARILSLRQEKIGEFKGAFLVIIIPVILACLLILPANLSTAAILFVTCMSLMFVGRIPFKYLALTIIGGLLVLSIFIGISLALHKGGRIETWKNRIEAYVSGEETEDNFQVNRAKIAIVTGGLFGRGPGNSAQRKYLPHPYSDFIYAIIIEEYGLIGGLLVLVCYLWLFFRASLIVRQSKRTFGAFLAFGLSLGLVLQAMINMAVAVNLVPVTGQTLPLVSMGGSSILFTSTSLGMILSVSWGVETDQKSQAAKTQTEEKIAEDE
jgi:cell division protein FtsW